MYIRIGNLYVLNVYYLHKHNNKKIKWVAAAVPLRPHTDEGKRSGQSVKNDENDAQEREKPSALEAQAAAAIVVTGNVIANESVNVTEAAAVTENVCGAGVLGE